MEIFLHLNLLTLNYWDVPHYLVSSAYQVKVMFVKELGHHLPRSQLVKNKFTKEKKKLLKLFKKRKWTLPLPQMWRKRLCHFRPIPLYPGNRKCDDIFYSWSHKINLNIVEKLKWLIMMTRTGTLSGSDHSKSQRSPWSGTSVGRMIRLRVKSCKMWKRRKMNFLSATTIWWGVKNRESWEEGMRL